MMMKMVGYLGKGAFGEVMKVKVGGDYYAVKKVDYSIVRFSWSSTQKMTQKRCRVYATK
jgi:hypothetical protein